MTSVKMNPNGNGLGLYMSKQICIAAGGDLKLTSQHMVGSSFSFKMAVKKLPQTEETGNIRLNADSNVSSLPQIIRPGDPGKLLL